MQWLAGAALLALACATNQPRRPDPSLAEVWRDYRKLPDYRALAIAGNFQKNRWVAGFSGGHETSAEAEAAALRECGVRRLRARAEAACQLYAIGDEIVWQEP